MADLISFAKWNGTPDGLIEKESYIVTKYFDLGTSSNKIKVIQFRANLIHAANTSTVLKVFYRTDTVSDWSLYGANIVNPNSDTGSEAIITNHLDDVKGIQFKIQIESSGNTSLNDYHFKFRKKRSFSVESE